jgi:hypothetical protein
MGQKTACRSVLVSAESQPVQPAGTRPAPTWLSLAVIRAMRQRLTDECDLGRTSVDDRKRF